MKLRISTPSFRHAALDVPAGLVVFLVALPLCLGIALASGAPLFSGIIAGVVGGAVISIFSGSELSVSGPAAGLATVVASAILTLGDFPTFLAAVVIAGILQLVIAALNAGRLGDFIPHSVIKGMLAAIGVSIILKQLPHTIGYDKDFVDEAGIEGLLQWHSVLQDPMKVLDSGIFAPGAVLITVVCLAIMLAWELPSVRRQRWSTLVSGTLVAVVVGTVINQILGAWTPEYALGGCDHHLVSLPILGDGQSTASLFTLPNAGAFLRADVWAIAVTIAVIASIESILSVEAVDKMDPDKRISDVNRELVAQGIGNTVSGLIGGLPVTSVIVRSSANVYAGGKTRTSSFVHGITLAAAVVLFPALLNLIPLACLAAVLLMVGYKLASAKVIWGMWKEGWTQFIPFVITLVVVVAKDILVGVGVGLLASAYFVMKSNHRKSIICVNDGPNYLIRFNKDITFVHKALLKEVLRAVPENSRLIVDGTRAHYIDHDIAELLHDFETLAANRAILVTFKSVHKKGINA